MTTTTITPTRAMVGEARGTVMTMMTATATDTTTAMEAATAVRSTPILTLIHFYIAGYGSDGYDAYGTGYGSGGSYYGNGGYGSGYFNGYSGWKKTAAEKKVGN